MGFWWSGARLSAPAWNWVSGWWESVICLHGFGLRVHEESEPNSAPLQPTGQASPGSQGGWGGNGQAGQGGRGRNTGGQGTKGPPEMSSLSWLNWVSRSDNSRWIHILWDLKHKPSGGPLFRRSLHNQAMKLGPGLKLSDSTCTSAHNREASDRGSQNHTGGSEGVRAESQGISLRDPEFGTIWRVLLATEVWKPRALQAIQALQGWYPLIYLTLPMPSLVLWLFQLCCWPSENLLVFQIIL